MSFFLYANIYIARPDGTIDRYSPKKYPLSEHAWTASTTKQSHAWLYLNPAFAGALNLNEDTSDQNLENRSRVEIVDSPSYETQLEEQAFQKAVDRGSRDIDEVLRVYGAREEVDIEKIMGNLTKFHKIAVPHPEKVREILQSYLGMRRLSRSE